MHSLAQRAFVDVSGIEANRCGNVRVHGRTEGEVPSDADSQHAEFPVGIGAGLQIVQRGPRIGIVGRDLFRDLVRIAFLRARLVVRQHGPGRFQFVIDLRDNHGIARTRNLSRSAPDGSGDLKDFGKQEHSRPRSRRRRRQHVTAHRTGGS
jgi:hypothetical protein